MTMTTETRRLIGRHFDRCDGMADGSRNCDICRGRTENGDVVYYGRTVQVAEMYCCGPDCALEALGGTEPTVPAPPVPTRELARDAWKRIGGDVASAPPVERWPATEAFLDLMSRHPRGVAPQSEWQYVYRLLHPVALNAECEDMLRQARGVR